MDNHPTVEEATRPARAGRREWIGLAVIALPCVVYAMDLTVLNMALPAISAELKPSSTQLLWIVDIYGFMVAGFLMTMGTLGDRIGRRRLLMVGAAAFGVASILAAFSTSAEMLIVLRALLGIAGATLAPSTLSLIRNMFGDARERTLAIGIWVSSYSAGAAIGPVLGGALLEYFWWGSAFLIGVPVMVLLLVVGPVLLPEYRDPAAGRLDLRSAALSLGAVLSLIHGIKRVAEQGPDWHAALAILAGIALGGWFVRRQRHLDDPMIDLRLFRRPAFTAALVTYTLGTFVVFGVFIFASQHLQLVLGMSPLQAGLWSLPFAFAFIAGSLVTPMLARRHPPGRVIAGGLLLGAGGFVLLAVTATSAQPLPLVLAFTLYSLGLAPVFTLATDLIVGHAPPERAGAASALSETGSEFGGALGIAVLGSIGAAVYRQVLADAAGVPPEVADTARSTLGAALDVARQLDGAVAERVAEASRNAFVRGLQVTAIVAAVASLAAAFWVRRSLAAVPAKAGG